MPEPMPPATLGRRILTLALILGLATDVLQPLFAFTSGGLSDVPTIDSAIMTVVGILIRLTIVILLFFETYKGRAWARWVLGAFFLLSALNPLLSATGTWQEMLAAWGDLAWPVYVAIGMYTFLGFLILLTGPIGAYQADVRAKESGKDRGPGIE